MITTRTPRLGSSTGSSCPSSSCAVGSSTTYTVPVSELKKVLSPEQYAKLNLAPNQCGVGLKPLEQLSTTLGLTPEQLQAIRSAAVPISRFKSEPSTSGVSSPPTVTPAPPYQPTPEQKAWEEFYGKQIKDIIEKGGYGLPEETKQTLIQQQFALLRQQENEAIKALRTSMERRGLTNSLFLFSQEQKIRAATTMAMSQAVTDVNIRDALTKLSSFENALGRAASFLGYLAEESARKYQPQYNTWVTQQQMLLESYRAQLDAYRAQVEGQIESALTAQRYQYEMELARLDAELREKLYQMQLQAQSSIAAMQGFFRLGGLLLGLALGGGLGFL